MNLEKLEKLSELKKKGILSQKEFDTQKAELLDNKEEKAQKQYKADRFAEYEKASGIIWIIIAIIQILSLVLILAGIWNLFAAISRFNISKKIKNRDADVPELYEGITGLIVIGVINLIFGGFFGILAVGFDFWVRSEILANRDIFDNKDGISPRILVEKAGSSNYDKLEEAHNLLKQGVITKQEYETMKKQLI